MLEFFPVNPSPSIVDNQRVSREVAAKPKGIDEAFEEFLGFEVANGAASSDTIANYKSQTRFFLQWCCDVQLNPLLADKQHIQRYRRYLLDQDYKIATIRLKLQVVRRFFDALIDHQLITFNPANQVKAPEVRSSPRKIQYLDLEQLQQLLALTEGNVTKLKRDRVILGLMALHGLRTIEVRNFSFGDISRRDGRYLINVASKRAEREVKLREDFYLWLLNHLAGKKLIKSLPIITSLSGNNYGKRISRDGLRRTVNGYLQEIGLRGSEIRLSNHALRHTFGTQVYHSTKDIRLVQDALGHASIKTTAKYVHVVEHIAAADCIDI